MDLEYVRQRITQLRMRKGVSESKMSTDLGHSKSYIQNIVSGKSAPSLQEFLYICDYLEVSPGGFFDLSQKEPILIQRAITGMRNLSDDDLLPLISIIDRLDKGRS